MTIADFDHNVFDPSRQSAEDEKLLVKFFIKPVLDQGATKKEGRPIYKDVEYIDIKIPGNRTAGACRPASFQDKQRFARHYSAFKQRIEMPVSGTPLSEWTQISRSLAEELGFYNVKTVEQLVDMSDTQASKFMGIQSLKQQARVWLAQSKESAKASEMAEALAQRDVKIAELERKLDQLSAQAPQQAQESTEFSGDTAPRRRGRPRLGQGNATVSVDKRHSKSSSG